MLRTSSVISIICAFFVSMTAFAADPTATNYTANECCGTHIPYPARQHDTALPDTLAPVFINHVGRHGARFPSSPSNTLELLRTLHRADSAKALTPLGKDLMKLADLVAARSHNRWGALDSLGMAEQRGIASRMFKAYPSLFKGGNVSAISSYSPRCVMSMYEFTHQLDRLNNNVEIITSSGRQNSQLMRPFDLDAEYLDWRDSRAWEEPYNMAYETTAPTAPARRLTGDFLSSEDARRLSMTAYDVLSCLPSMGMANELAKYFTPEEYNALWALSNLRFYLRYSANTLSTLPADIASALLMNLISTTDAAVLGESPQTVMLRFGHAETLMPLLSLMRLRGCYYMTNYFDTTAMHWRNFHVVPMAANLQMILLKSKSGNYYVRFDLNEEPVPLMPNSDAIYLPWATARQYLNRCLPLHLQL